jgi:hypothetical protein
MPGARCTHGPRAAKKHAAEPQVQPKQPAFPAQWFYGLYAISPVTGLFCHRHFASSCEAWRQRRGARTTRLHRPRSHHSSVDGPRPSHPRLTCRDDRACAPLVEAGWRKETPDLGESGSGIFFRAGLDDPNQLESLMEIRTDGHRHALPGDAAGKAADPVSQQEKKQGSFSLIPRRRT